MADSLIYRVHGLQLRYASRTIVEIDDLGIRQGEVLAIIGPNGAGKSTLLRALALLERPAAGEIRFAGAPVGYPVRLSLRRQISMVFQRPILLSGTVRQNIAYPLRIRRLRTEERVAEVLDRLDLAALAEAPVHRISGGEYQRVALARALILEPRVLLLDEPAANLDPQNVERIEAIINAIGSQSQTTVVLVTHNVHQARRLADRTGVMLHGRIIELGETGQMLQSPGDPRAAAFIRGDLVY